MVQQDFVWESAGAQSNERFPREATPQRLALTVVVVACSQQDDHVPRLIVVNPHPESWNNWQLPYASLQYDAPTEWSGDTFSDISALLAETREKHADEYRQLLSQAPQMLVGGGHPGGADGRALLRSFALRFSATAKVFTAYEFAYHPYRDAVHREALAHVQHDFVPLDGMPIGDGQWAGLPISSNVLALLESAEHRRAIVQAFSE